MRGLGRNKTGKNFTNSVSNKMLKSWHLDKESSFILILLPWPQFWDWLYKSQALKPWAERIELGSGFHGTEKVRHQLPWPMGHCGC